MGNQHPRVAERFQHGQDVTLGNATATLQVAHNHVLVPAVYHYQCALRERQCPLAVAESEVLLAALDTNVRHLARVPDW